MEPFNLLYLEWKLHMLFVIMQLFFNFSEKNIASSGSLHEELLENFDATFSKSQQLGWKHHFIAQSLFLNDAKKIRNHDKIPTMFTLFRTKSERKLIFKICEQNAYIIFVVEIVIWEFSEESSGTIFFSKGPKNCLLAHWVKTRHFEAALTLQRIWVSKWIAFNINGIDSPYLALVLVLS